MEVLPHSCYSGGFNGRPRNELLKTEIVEDLLYAQYLTPDWREKDNHRHRTG